jgi:predicted nucleotidyltransferase
MVAPDPNGFYATVVQASATVVATIGGFKTGTIVNLADQLQRVEVGKTGLHRLQLFSSGQP